MLSAQERGRVAEVKGVERLLRNELWRAARSNAHTMRCRGRVAGWSGGRDLDCRPTLEDEHFTARRDRQLMARGKGRPGILEQCIEKRSVVSEIVLNSGHAG